jgi:hypothetical protein
MSHPMPADWIIRSSTIPNPGVDVPLLASRSKQSSYPSTGRTGTKRPKLVVTSAMAPLTGAPSEQSVSRLQLVPKLGRFRLTSRSASSASDSNERLAVGLISPVTEVIRSNGFDVAHSVCSAIGVTHAISARNKGRAAPTPRSDLARIRGECCLCKCVMRHVSCRTTMVRPMSDRV